MSRALAGRAFITGTSSGLGEALALALLDQGWQVLGVSRRHHERLESNPNFQFCQLDITEPQALESGLAQRLSESDSLDLVILNAGILGRIRDLSETPLEDMRKTMEVNVWANKTILDLVFESVKKVAQVIAISSGAAVNGNRGWNGYSISKAALNMLVSLYSKEQPKTHFCSLAPGLVDTAMQDYLCGLEPDHRFEAVGRIREARSTELMPSPEALAPRLLEVIRQIPSHLASGEFADIRKLEFAPN